MKIEQIPFTLESLLDELVRDFEKQCEEKKLSFFLDLDSRLNNEVLGDPTRIRQVIVNFFSNALKFTESGFISFSVKGEEEDFVTFTVSDTGIGISDDKRETVFHLFSQADTSTTREHGGTGLGLTLSKSLTELMGGSLSFESEIGKGSEFSFSIPLPHRSHGRIKPKPGSALERHLKLQGENGEARPTKGPAAPHIQGRILFVTESEELRSLQEALEEEGGNVTVVHGGKEAIFQFEKHNGARADEEKQPFELLIIDTEFSDLGGGELVSYIRHREKESGEHLPILSLRASDNAAEAGEVDGSLTKPIEQASFIEQVQSILES